MAAIVLPAPPSQPGHPATWLAPGRSPPAAQASLRKCGR